MPAQTGICPKGFVPRSPEVVHNSSNFFAWSRFLNVVSLFLSSHLYVQPHKDLKARGGCGQCAVGTGLLTSMARGELVPASGTCPGCGNSSAATGPGKLALIFASFWSLGWNPLCNEGLRVNLGVCFPGLQGRCFTLVPLNPPACDARQWGTTRCGVPVTSGA